MMILQLFVIFVFFHSTSSSCQTRIPGQYKYLRVKNDTRTQDLLLSLGYHEFADEQVVVCSDLSFEKPINYNFEIQESSALVIGYSVIPTIFSNFSNIIVQNFNYLKLQDSQIENIETGAFSNLKTLKTLDLSKNKLTLIPDEILENLPNLKKLNLEKNLIENLDNMKLSKLSKLKQLNLKDNKLKTIEGAVFQNLIKLEKIDLSNNPLSKFQNVIFADLKIFVAKNTSLKTFDSNLKKISLLDLSDGILENIDFKNFQRLQRMFLKNNKISTILNFDQADSLELDLSQNQLTHINVIPPKVRILNLSYNKISKIQKRNIQANRIVKINLGHNEISEIEPGYFANLGSLSNLILSNNNIEILREKTFENCIELGDINLSFNKLRVIENNAFHQIPHLKKLDFSNNNLENLNLEMISVDNYVTLLFLHNNEITELNVNKFLEKFSHVRSISLNKNPWNCNNLKEVVKQFQEKNVKIPDFYLNGNAYELCLQNANK